MSSGDKLEQSSLLVYQPRQLPSMFEFVSRRSLLMVK